MRSSHAWPEFGITLSVSLFNAQTAHHGGVPGCATNPQLSNTDKYKNYITHHLFVHSMISSWNEAANWNFDAFFPTRWSRFQTEVMLDPATHAEVKLHGGQACPLFRVPSPGSGWETPPASMTDPHQCSIRRHGTKQILGSHIVKLTRTNRNPRHWDFQNKIRCRFQLPPINKGGSLQFKSHREHLKQRF